MNRLPSWVAGVVAKPAMFALSQQTNALDSRKLDGSYLEFLEEQIRADASGPEWTAMLRRRLEGLRPWVGKILIHVTTWVPGERLSLYARADTFETVFWEM
jgi:hypothetical protein